MTQTNLSSLFIAFKIVILESKQAEPTMREGIPGDALSFLLLEIPTHSLLYSTTYAVATFVPRSFVRGDTLHGRENNIEQSHDDWLTPRMCIHT